MSESSVPPQDEADTTIVEEAAAEAVPEPEPAVAQDAPAAASTEPPPAAGEPAPGWDAGLPDSGEALAERPEVLVGAAFVGGVVSALILKRLAR